MAEGEEEIEQGRLERVKAKRLGVGKAGLNGTQSGPPPFYKEGNMSDFVAKKDYDLLLRDRDERCDEILRQRTEIARLTKELKASKTLHNIKAAFWENAELEIKELKKQNKLHSQRIERDDKLNETLTRENAKLRGRVSELEELKMEMEKGVRECPYCKTLLPVIVKCKS